MGLFNKKSDQEKEIDEKIEYYCGGFGNNDIFREKLIKNNLNKNTSNLYVKKILKWELTHKTLNLEQIEIRLDELLTFDNEKMWKEVINKDKEDTSTIHSNEDLENFINSYEIKKQNLKEEEKQNREDEKQKREDERKQKKLDMYGVTKVDGKLIFNNPPENQGTTFSFDCIVREERFRSNTTLDVDNQSAKGVVYDDYFEFTKTGVFLKSDLGKRKVYYRNVISVDLDKSGYFHLTSSVAVRMRDGEIISLESGLSSLIEPLYEFLHTKWELYQERQDQPVQVASALVSNADELRKYAELHKEGIITEEEFKKKKEELL